MTCADFRIECSAGIIKFLGYQLQAGGLKYTSLVEFEPFTDNLLLGGTLIVLSILIMELNIRKMIFFKKRFDKNRQDSVE
ncbi:hypothetical protein [Liquorilactobacillus satsumensis]|uniref:hypothetical protein n=1 Tax=Liquorilactobacillus satsumensis TaxID=259059 RepID=UPI0039ECF610